MRGHSSSDGCVKSRLRLYVCMYVCYGWVIAVCRRTAGRPSWTHSSGQVLSAVFIRGASHSPPPHTQSSTLVPYRHYSATAPLEVGQLWLRRVANSPNVTLLVIVPKPQELLQHGHRALR